MSAALSISLKERKQDQPLDVHERASARPTTFLNSDDLIGWRLRIGAPQSFRLPSNGTEIPYVRPLKINRETDSFDTLDEIPDSLPWDDEEGRWLAGIGIHLEPGGRNSYPKTEFTIQLRFTLQDQRCELQVASYLAEKKLELTGRRFQLEGRD